MFCKPVARIRQRLDRDRSADDVSVDDYLADFSGEFHDLRHDDFSEVLDPESYVQSQALAERLV
jgi:hypothetical protein